MEIRPYKCHLYIADRDYAACLVFSTLTNSTALVTSPKGITAGFLRLLKYQMTSSHVALSKLRGGLYFGKVAEYYHRKPMFAWKGNSISQSIQYPICWQNSLRTQELLHVFIFFLSRN